MTKIYVQRIEACWKCPFYAVLTTTKVCCASTPRPILDDGITQSWCPLQNFGLTKQTNHTAKEELQRVENYQ